MPTAINWSVILDVEFDRGLLFFNLKNATDQPVFNVVTKFNSKIFCPPASGHSNLELGELPIFKGITFLAPKKEIRVFIDSLVSYMTRGMPMLISFTIDFDGPDGSHAHYNINHNLSIYRGIGYIEKPDTVPAN